MLIGQTVAFQQLSFPKVDNVQCSSPNQMSMSVTPVFAVRMRRVSTFLARSLVPVQWASVGKLACVLVSMLTSCHNFPIL